MERQVKVGVKLGTGVPVYQWNVWILDLAYEEALKFLDEDQYAYLAEQMRELAREEDPAHTRLFSVAAVEDFQELREKGGVLGKINVRVYFALDKRKTADIPHHAIVVLGASKKESEGKMPEADKIKIKRRLRKYMAGEYGKLPL